MKTARFALLNSLLLLFMLTACKNEMPYSPDEDLRNQYTLNWLQTFGIIDPAQDWNMAASITADVDPSAFGQGYTVNIYNSDPRTGGVLIGRTSKASSFKIDVEKGAKTVYVRAYTPDHSMYCEREYPIVNGKVDIRTNSRAELSLSRAEGDEEPEGYQWILACEDLGSVGDYDFNDIVIGINYVAGEGKKLTITPLAAGGTLKATVSYNGTDLFESHYPLSKQETETGKYNMVNTTTWGGPGSPSAVIDDVDFSITDDMGGIKIKVIKTDNNQETETIISAPETGTAPQVICVPGDWEWPKETVNIQTAYPEFTDWSKDASIDDWNDAKVEGKVVKRITAPVPVVKHNSFIGTTNDNEPYKVIINGSEQMVNSGERIYVEDVITSIKFPYYLDFSSGYSNLGTLDLSDLDTSNITDMKEMFVCCANLKSINLTGFDTSNVTDMSCMFQGCESLTSIDFSSFNTSKVTDMSYFLENCKSLTSVDLSTINTANVTNMESMFAQCFELNSLDVRGFDTSKVTNMDFMFSACKMITSLDLSQFNTSNVTRMRCMFRYCDNLTTLDLRSFDTSKVTTMNAMFHQSSELTSIDLSSFNTKNVENMSGMFSNCYKLDNLNLSNFDTSKVTDMSGMFSACHSLSTLDLGNFDTSNVTNMMYMFGGCELLSTLDLGNFDTSNVTNMSDMFFKCTSLSTLNVSSFDTSKVTKMNEMFYECTSLTTLNISNFNTNNVTDISGMFNGCSALERLNIYNFSSSGLSTPSGEYGSLFYRSYSDMAIYTNDTFKTWCIANVNLPSNVEWLTSWP